MGFGKEDLSEYLDLLGPFILSYPFGIFVLGFTVMSPDSLCSLEWI